jgi:hypothetical protein
MVWVVSLFTTDVSTRRVSPILSCRVFGVQLGLVSCLDPLAHLVLYPPTLYMRRYLNSFRGEPAITRFDWSFTPSHKSSPSFATDVGSVLQCVLPHLQPAHGEITGFRV